ncbi:Hypothetical Protein FCC1311_060882 [Hondaea fermentalgiana]|uniref:PH domain-containing protein n=1 Tax=Hondaea fermentalgiana TaxID=2315210 RepID=A0A2R5GJF6_9STRA|nr:Hypothetical Protein FCC1311_060882 [Hondaea fermentalgiana]|eukprot:GBG29868.1 Hypothetical Protein FCC1311_060882 [Hondaea fermentalgiana]
MTQTTELARHDNATAKEKSIHREGYLVKAPMSKGRSSLRSNAGLQGVLLGGLAQHKKSHKRYFVLEGSMLTYYERQGETKAKGALQLGPNAIIETIADEQGLVIVPFPGSKKELFLTSDDTEELLAWQTSIREACTKASDSIIDEHEHDIEQKEDEDDEDDLDADNEGHDGVHIKEEGEEGDISESKRGRSASEQKTVAAWKEEWARRVTPHTRLPSVKYNIVKEGELEIKSRSTFGGWVRRYFVLTKDLFYYESIKAFEASKSACTQISLEARVCRAEEQGTREFTLYVIGATYTFRCDTDEDTLDWHVSRTEKVSTPQASSPTEDRFAKLRALRVKREQAQQGVE